MTTEPKRAFPGYSPEKVNTKSINPAGISRMPAEMRQTEWYAFEKEQPSNFTDGESIPAHYDKMFAGKLLDPNAIAKVYGITDHMQFAALKKILRAGKTDRKDLRQDILDSICALRRMLSDLDDQQVESKK
jgi:hypothetical protein